MNPASPSNPRRPVFGFWTVSLALHAAALLAILTIAPVREIVFERKPAQPAQTMTRGEELEKLIERIRAITARQLAERVALLERSTRRMDEHRERLEQTREPVREERAATAAERLRKKARELAPLQASLAEQLARAERERQPAAGAETAKRETPPALAAQQAIRRAMLDLGLDQREILDPQRDAETLQFKAAEAANRAAAARRELDRTNERLSRTRAERAETAGRIPATTSAAETAASEREALEAQLDAARREESEARDAGQRDREREAKNRARDLERRSRDARSRAERAARDLAKLRENESRAAEQEAGAAREAERLATAESEAARSAAEAASAARQRQADALAAAETALAARQPGTGSPETQSAPPTPPPPPAETIADLHAAAIAALENTADQYRSIKAHELAAARDIPFAEALENVRPVMPILEPVDRAILDRPIRDPGDIAPHKAAVERVESQVETMVDLAAKLLREIETRPAQNPGQSARELSLEQLLDRDPNPPENAGDGPAGPDPAALAAMENAAREDASQPAKDLTGTLPRENADAADSGPEPQFPNLFRSRDEPSLFGGLADLKNANLTLARTVGDGGTPAEWMFVDTWYTLGPFPNPNRANLRTKFPPETVVDLDATYPGKDGRQIRWEFVQSGNAKVAPAHDEEYAIYYAYTELFFDRDMDLWVALGSDDKSNVWVNGQPIWISGEQLKGWKPNEGFRKVPFQKGRNRILYRIENGWLQTAFSFAIRVAD